MPNNFHEFTELNELFNAANLKTEFNIAPKDKLAYTEVLGYLDLNKYLKIAEKPRAEGIFSRIYKKISPYLPTRLFSGIRRVFTSAYKSIIASIPEFVFKIFGNIFKIEEARISYNQENFTAVEQKLRQQLSIFSLSAQHMYLSRQQRSDAYLLLAESALQLGRDTAYYDLENALYYANDHETRKIILLRQLKLLANESEKNRTFNMEFKLAGLLQSKLEELTHLDNAFLKCHLQDLEKIWQEIITKINVNDEVGAKAAMNDFAAKDNLFLVRAIKPHGAIYEILFHHMQALCIVANLDASESEKGRQEFKMQHIQKMISCLKVVQSFELESAPENAKLLIETIRTKYADELTIVAKVTTLPEHIVSALTGLGVIKHDKALLTEEEIVKIPAMQGVSINSLETLVNEILVSDEFAKQSLSNGRNWLHYLPRIDFPYRLHSKAQNAAQRLIALGISPYDRDDINKTAFAYMPDDDPNQMLSIFRPMALCGFIGAEKEIARITNFLKTVKETPNTKDHLMILSGPPGVGKTEMIKAVAARNGYEILVFEKAQEEDSLLNKLESRMTKFFKDVKIIAAAGKNICIFMDEIDTITPKIKGDVENGYFNWDKIVTLLQEEVDACTGHKVVLIGATNFPEKIKDAISSRASKVHVRLPRADIRKIILQDKLRGVMVESQQIIDELAIAMNGWSPRQIERYVSEIFKTMNSDKRSIVTSADFKSHFEEGRMDNNYEISGVIIETSAMPSDVNDVRVDDFDIAIKEGCDNAQDFLERPQEYSVNGITQRNILLQGSDVVENIATAKALLSNAGCVFITVKDYNSLSCKELLSFIRQCEKVVLFLPAIDKCYDIDSLADLFSTKNLDKTALIIIASIDEMPTKHSILHKKFDIKQVQLPNEIQRQMLFSNALGKVENIEKDFSEDDYISLAKNSKGLTSPEIQTTIQHCVADVICQGHRNGPITLQFDIINKHLDHFKLPKPPSKKKVIPGRFNIQSLRMALHSSKI